MQVKYVGHNDCLLTDYNGKRYCFPKNKAVDVPQQVFTLMKSSGDAETEYLMVVEQPVTLKREEKIAETPKETPKLTPVLSKYGRGRPRKNEQR